MPALNVMIYHAFSPYRARKRYRLSRSKPMACILPCLQPVQRQPPSRRRYAVTIRSFTRRNMPPTRERRLLISCDARKRHTSSVFRARRGAVISPPAPRLPCRHAQMPPNRSAPAEMSVPSHSPRVCPLRRARAAARNHAVCYGSVERSVQVKSAYSVLLDRVKDEVPAHTGKRPAGYDITYARGDTPAARLMADVAGVYAAQRHAAAHAREFTRGGVAAPARDTLQIRLSAVGTVAAACPAARPP